MQSCIRERQRKVLYRLEKGKAVERAIQGTDAAIKHTKKTTGLLDVTRNQKRQGVEFSLYALSSLTDTLILNFCHPFLWENQFLCHQCYAITRFLGARVLFWKWWTKIKIKEIVKHQSIPLERIWRIIMWSGIFVSSAWHLVYLFILYITSSREKFT